MKTLPGYGFKLWIESDTVSRHLKERYEQSLTPLQFDKALPGFRRSSGAASAPLVFFRLGQTGNPADARVVQHAPERADWPARY